MIYQSFSGDSSIGEGNLQMENCIFHNQYADDGEAMFYVTNTHALVSAKNCSFYAGTEDKEYSSKSYFVICEENEKQHWGRSGSNGGQMTMTLSGCKARGLLKAAERDSTISVEADDEGLTKDKSSSGDVEVRW